MCKYIIRVFVDPCSIVGTRLIYTDDYSHLLDFNLMKGLTALCSAALDGRLETVRYLLDNGADPNKKDELGEVALHCAAKFGIISTYSEHSICRFACCYTKGIDRKE